MRRLALLLIALLPSCAAPGGPYPSLQPRPAEAIDPRLPVPQPPVPSEMSVGLASQLDSLVSQAIAADEQFRPLAQRAGELAGAAGAEGSESWVVAQQALSAAVSARGPVTRAVGDIDALGAQRIQSLGGIGAADMAAIEAAAARVAEIDEREAATIAAIQARLER